MTFKQTKAHKVAKKVASSSPRQSKRIYLADWLEQAYPEVFEQYQAIKDIEDAVDDEDELMQHIDLHLARLELISKMGDMQLKSTNKFLKKIGIKI